MWKVPRQVVTPDLEEDIKRLLSPEILRLFKLCEDKEGPYPKNNRNVGFFRSFVGFQKLSEQYKQTNEKGREWHDVYR